MPLTYDIELPLNEELTVPEVTLTTGALRAGSVYFGKFCETESKEFMLCKDDFDDPRKCINEGKDVTACALNFFRKMKETCYEEFQAYATCLETKSVDYQVSKQDRRHSHVTFIATVCLGAKELGRYGFGHVVSMVIENFSNSLLVLNYFNEPDDLNQPEINSGHWKSSQSQVRSHSQHGQSHSDQALLPLDKRLLCKSRDKSPDVVLQNIFSAISDNSAFKYEKVLCRKPQAVYDKCVLENFNIQRPSVGYYGIPKIHETKYPKPEPKQRPTFEKPPKLPADEYNNPVDSIYDYRRMG
ncbi:NADH dehydrogenase [ubiquinone] 1 alpha subcomplex subunit 8 [Nymphon striatum]|nr:NADH dehydrogenase [ubiquinone] 1 alpha subcomplex subunit 8 [Nymphon striatum]